MCTSQLHSFISCCITYLLALVSTHLNAYVHTHPHTGDYKLLEDRLGLVFICHLPTLSLGFVCGEHLCVPVELRLLSHDPLKSSYLVYSQNKHKIAKY